MRSIQNEYICNADTTPIWDDIRNAYMNELSEMPEPAIQNLFKVYYNLEKQGGEKR